MGDRYTQSQRQGPSRYYHDHEYPGDADGVPSSNNYAHQNDSNFSRLGSERSMAFYQIPQQAFSADRRSESHQYTSSMPFSQQTPNLPHNDSFSMGHMVNSLPSVSSQNPSFPAGIVANPGQQSPHLSRQPTSTPYFQQHSHSQPYQAQSGHPHQYQDRMVPMGTPAQFQHNPAYPMQSFGGAYPMYPNQHIYQPSPMMSPGLPSGPQLIRARMGRMDDHMVQQPSGGTGGYLSERIQYPFHAAQVQQHLGFSSSGSNATCGSIPERAIQAAIPRGPPRKPKQSGHALWVGNLPPGATVADLKDHFSRGLSSDIESLKLISKSNCAFVNYKTQAACAVAMQSFHDSRFHGTRLVCRLRRASGPTPPAAQPQVTVEEPLGDGEIEQHDASIRRSRERVPERFFVLKSLTLHDLEVSVRTGYWATQSHNEDVLNQAYNSADNVYLVFSANKSGEYFGYARMTSTITSEPVPEDPKLSPQVTRDSDEQAPIPASVESGSIASAEAGPRSIPTPATEWAPKGRIIDDLARGTIFWEADPEDSTTPGLDRVLVDGTGPLVDGVDDIDHTQSHESSHALQKTNTSTTTGDSEGAVEYLGSSGGSFSVEWVSTRRVPFYTTRGLRNPWNVNREVKIARDGTELEPSVGKKLLALFGNPAIGGMPRRVAMMPPGPAGPQVMPMMPYN